MLTVAEPGSASAGEQGGVTPHHWSPSEDDSDEDVMQEGADSDECAEHHRQHRGGSSTQLGITLGLPQDDCGAQPERGSGKAASSGTVEASRYQESVGQLQTAGSGQVDNSNSTHATLAIGTQKGRVKRSRRRRSGQGGSDAEEGWEVM
jgi:hypothetical protein